ncbi:hypothetical protein L1049_019161 [Liquidambar formosana]|uniref:Uncharacterized protein n=1 Tax=Liquidambar formosana TaxID=63359 RepID=A0AAP0RB46_LIQFO
MVATATASYFLLTADYGPEPNALDPIKRAIESAEQSVKEFIFGQGKESQESKEKAEGAKLKWRNLSYGSSCPEAFVVRVPFFPRGSDFHSSVVQKNELFTSLEFRSAEIIELQFHSSPHFFDKHNLNRSGCQ